MRVLIIDDDRAHGESLSDLLNTRGHEAYFAQSRAEAEWLLGLFRFQLAIVDFDMPGPSGVQVVRELRERDPGLAAVVMSAREANRRVCEETGSFPFLPKPIRVDALLRLLANRASGQAGSSLMVRLGFPLERYSRGDES